MKIIVHIILSLLTTLNIGTFEDILKILNNVTLNPEEHPVFVWILTISHIRPIFYNFTCKYYLLSITKT